jgi:hypothetical protein
MDGLWVVVVVGDGKWVAPVDFAVRRPNLVGAGAPCRDQLSWTRPLIDDRLAALRKRRLALPPLMSKTWDGKASDSQVFQD